MAWKAIQEPVQRLVLTDITGGQRLHCILQNSLRCLVLGIEGIGRIGSLI